MTRLDVLLNELCSDGVPFKRLEECCNLEKGNTPIQKAVPGEYPLVVTTNERKSSSTFQFDQPSVCVPLVSSRGHGVACLNQVYYQEGKFALGNILCAVTPLKESGLSAKFLYYYLNLKKDTLIVPLMKGGANVSLTVNSLKRVKVAIPPLLVQDEIVQRLQAFEALLDTLSEELSARRKQYEYYRNRLLTFDNESKKMPLSDVANLFRGEYITQKGSKPGDIPVILGGQEPAYYIDKANHDGEIVVIARSGVSAGFVSYWNQPIYVTDGFGYEAKKDVATPKYLYYVLKRKEPELNAMKRGAGVPHVSGEMLGKVKLSIPPIAVQERLVNVLDNFESICSDLSVGLPAEIEARQKQYEYYRDLLLTFAETGSTLVTDGRTDGRTDGKAS